MTPYQIQRLLIFKGQDIQFTFPELLRFCVVVVLRGSCFVWQLFCVVVVLCGSCFVWQLFCVVVVLCGSCFVTSKLAWNITE